MAYFVHDYGPSGTLGNFPVDLLHTVEDFVGPMALVAFAEHRPHRDVERQKDLLGATTNVCAGSSPDDNWHHMVETDMEAAPSTIARNLMRKLPVRHETVADLAATFTIWNPMDISADSDPSILKISGGLRNEVNARPIRNLRFRRLKNRDRSSLSDHMSNFLPGM